MRLIDADSLQRRICGAKCGCEYEDCWNEEGCVYDQFISNSHTINAVPVVRCRECDHKTHDGNGFPYCLKLEMYLNKELDFFCKYGEREGGVSNEP